MEDPYIQTETGSDDEQRRSQQEEDDYEGNYARDGAGDRRRESVANFPL